MIYTTFFSENDLMDETGVVCPSPAVRIRNLFQVTREQHHILGNGHRLSGNNDNPSSCEMYLHVAGSVNICRQLDLAKKFYIRAGRRDMEVVNMIHYEGPILFDTYVLRLECQDKITIDEFLSELPNKILGVRVDKHLNCLFSPLYEHLYITTSIYIATGDLEAFQNELKEQIKSHSTIRGYTLYDRPRQSWCGIHE